MVALLSSNGMWTPSTFIMQRMCDSVIPVKNDTFVATLAPIILSSE